LKILYLNTALELGRRREEVTYRYAKIEILVHMQGAGLNLRDESKYHELRFVAVEVPTSFKS
jgi:hypothetical protein